MELDDAMAENHSHLPNSMCLNEVIMINTVYRKTKTYQRKQWPLLAADGTARNDKRALSIRLFLATPLRTPGYFPTERIVRLFNAADATDTLSTVL